MVYDIDNYVKICKTYKKSFYKFEQTVKNINKKVSIKNYYKDKINKFEQTKNVTVLNFNNETKKVKFKCNSCENIKTLSSSIMNESQLCNTVCSECSNTSQRSLPEYELEKITNMYSYTITSDRKILNGKELDLYMPNIKLAIEYCGLRWHSLRYTKFNKNYHYEKYSMCKELGIKLITIFEDEYAQDTNKLFKKLSYILNNKKDLKVFKSNIIDKNEYIDIVTDNDFILSKTNSKIFFKITDINNITLCVFGISEKNNYIVIDNITILDNKYYYLKSITNIIKSIYNKKIFYINDLRYSISDELETVGFKYRKFFHPVGWKTKGQKRFTLNGKITTETTIYDCGYILYVI